MTTKNVGFVFTTVFLVSYGFVKMVLLVFSPSTAIFAKAKFGKRKFFLRHPVIWRRIFLILRRNFPNLPNELS